MNNSFTIPVEGIVVSDTIVVVNREQGGAVNITNNNIQMHSIFTLSQLLSILKQEGKIDEKTVVAVAKYISESQIKAQGKSLPPVKIITVCT